MPTFKQRIAVMRAHKSICFYCKNLIGSLDELDIDHLIPKSLTPGDLSVLLSRLGKPEFEIESYSNWVPAHRGCNGPKTDIVFEDVTLLFFLELVNEKVPAVRREEERFDREAAVKDVMSRLIRQIETGTLSKATAIAFIERSEAPPRANIDPLILSFSINLNEATSPDPRFKPLAEVLMSDATEEVETEIMPDALLAELEASLKCLNALITRSEAPQDNGETLSVRFAVWLLDLDTLPKRFPNDWKLLGVAPHSEVYPGQDAIVLSEQAAIHKRNDVILDNDSDEPLPYRYCPMCASQKFVRQEQSNEQENIYYIRCQSCGWGESY